MATFVLTLVFGAIGIGLVLLALFFTRPFGDLGRVLLIAAVVLFGFAAWGVCDLARAEDGHGGHMRWHEYYRHWKQPGSELSCCNARQIGPAGEDLSGDCEPTRGEARRGADGKAHWFAWLRQESRWIEISDGRVIRERNPAGEEAHLCATRGMLPDGSFGWRVVCFVPPDTGG